MEECDPQPKTPKFDPMIEHQVTATPPRHCEQCRAEAVLVEGLCASCLSGGLAWVLGAPARNEADDMLPMEFAGCVLERRIARGGMGIVFAARQPELGRVVAVKVLASGIFAGDEARERFLAEAQTVARLEHPGIVPLLEAGEWEDQAYFIMPLLAGGSLAGLLSAGRRHSPDEAAALLAPLARAVHHAHQRGVLHRDIKPGNILLDESGNPHLTDFGVAKIVERETVMTRTHSFLGTPAYMAPEQAGSGSEVTTSSDVYGLGAVFYELLTGQVPFAGGTTMETVRQLLTKDPRRPSALNPRVDRDLETICLTCLEKDPAQRYLSAAALAEDLERWQRGEPIAARHAGWLERGWKWMRRHPTLAAAWTIALVAAFLALAVGTVLSLRLGHSRTISAALAEERRAEVARLHASDVAEHLDRHDAPGARRAASECLAMEEAAAPGPARSAAIARAKERIAAVERVSPRLLQDWKHEAATSSGALSPDGRVAACLSAGVLHVYDTASGQRLMEPLELSREQSLGYMDCLGFNATGELLFAVARKGGQLHASMVSLKESRWLWRDQRLTIYPQFDAAGERLLFGHPAGVRWIDARSGEPGPFLREGNFSRLALSPDNRWAAIASASGDIFIHDARDGTGLHGPLRVPGRSNIVDMNFSSDGRWFAACTGTEQGAGQLGVWEMPMARLSPPPAEQQNKNIWGVDFSPDGKRLLAWGFQNTRVRDPAEAAPPGELFAGSGFVNMAAWSPDNSMVATCGTLGSVFFWDVGYQTETLMRLPHDGQVYTAAWSPDGNHMLTTGGDGCLRYWRLPPRDFSLLGIQADAGIQRMRWSPDGRILCADSRQGTKAWDAMRGQPATPIAPPTPPDSLPEGWMLSPGHDLAVMATDANGGFEIIETSSGRARHHLRHPGRSCGIELIFAFSPDGSRLLSMGKDATLESCEALLWDTATGKPAAFRLPHKDDILAGTFSPDGSMIATAGMDMVTRLWRASDGFCIGALPRHGYWVWNVAFSPDGSRLATASADHTARVWDIRTLTSISPPMQHRNIVLNLAWNPQGTRLATLDSQARIRIWDTSDTFEPPAEPNPGK